jgi:RNA polymerase sigma factor (sigma-70 family)
MSVAGTISLNTTREPSLVSDNILVAEAKIGHRGAFDELYKRHAEKMFRITHRMMRNREDAEDAVQECFLNAFIHLKSFDGRSRFSTWLTRIAMNAVLMKLRRGHLSREVPMEQPEVTRKVRPEHRLADTSLNPEERYAKNEREVILRNAIAELRPRIRKALEIYQLQECSLHETAEALEIPVSAAKGRLFHARVALRESRQLQFVAPSNGRNPARLTRSQVRSLTVRRRSKNEKTGLIAESLPIAPGTGIQAKGVSLEEAQS